MTDVEEKKEVTQPVAEQQPQVEAKAAPEPSPSKKPFVSLGAKVRHWSTYLGVDWIWNAASGVAFSYWGTFTETGKKWFTEPVDKFFREQGSRFIKDPQKLKKSVGRANTFAGIIAGGMLFTIPPLLYLESKKVKKRLTRALDEKIYGKDIVDAVPKFQESYDAIDREPEKGFWTGMGARGLALAPLLALVFNPTSNKWLQQNYFGHISKASKGVSNAVGLNAKRLFRRHDATEAQKRFDYCHDEALAMDIGLGIAYAPLHSFFYNMLASLVGSKKKEPSPADAPRTEDTPVATEHAASTTSFAAREAARQNEPEVAVAHGVG